MNRIVSYGFLFVGLTLALLAVPSEVETLSFAVHSDELVETEAHVTANFTRKHRKGPDTQTVEYAYVIDGKKWKGDNHLTRLTDRPGAVQQLVHRRDGDETIAVFYLPDDPSTSAIHREVGYVVPTAILGFTALCLLAGLDGVVRGRPHPRQRPST